MNTYSKTIPLLIFLSFLSACCPLTSVHPLSNPDKATFDDRLKGTWKLQKEGDTVFLHIGKLKDNKTQVVSIEHTDSGNLVTVAASMFPTEIKGNHFMNLNAIKVEFIERSNEIPPDEGGYYFFKYNFKDKDSFSFSMINENIVADAIKKGKLKGEIKKKPVRPNKGDIIKIEKIVCTSITDSTENLVRFFRETPVNTLFPEKDSFLFKRVK